MKCAFHIQPVMFYVLLSGINTIVFSPNMPVNIFHPKMFFLILLTLLVLCVYLLTQETVCRRCFPDSCIACSSTSVEDLHPVDDAVEDCPICFDSMDRGEVTLVCGHCCHLSCLLDWAAIRRTCPLCRASF